MENIRIVRFKSDPAGRQGAILPESDRWRLIIDADGNPRMFVRVKLSESQTGFLDLDDVLPDAPLAGLIDCDCGGENVEVSPEEVGRIMENLACPDVDGA